MKCDHYKDTIFLYEQLNDAEKELLTDHINTCEVCADLLKQVNEMRSLVHSSIPQITPLDSDRLTNRIMRAVSNEQLKPSRTFNWWPSLSGWKLLQLSLSSISIILVLSFGLEYTKKGQVRTRTKVLPETRITILNSSHFFGKFIPKDIEQVNFLEAQRQYRKSKQGEKTSYWSKLKKRYETDK